MNPDIVVGIASAVISLGGACISLYFSRKSQLAQAQAHEVELASWKQQYLGELRSWADESCDILSDTVHLCDLDPRKVNQPGFFEQSLALRSKLSAICDRGRWFFPNEEAGDFGQHKPSAFRGFRDPILDPLISAYKRIGELSYQEQSKNQPVREALVDDQRDFVDKVQDVLDPWSRNSEFSRIVNLMAELRGASLNAA